MLSSGLERTRQSLEEKSLEMPAVVGCDLLGAAEMSNPE